MKKIAIGIIGCGKIAQMRHIPEYAANANAKLCGFFDVNLQRAQELADQYGTKAYGSYQELPTSMARRLTEATRSCWRIRRSKRSVS